MSNALIAALRERPHAAASPFASHFRQWSTIRSRPLSSLRSCRARVGSPQHRHRCSPWRMKRSTGSPRAWSSLIEPRLETRLTSTASKSPPLGAVLAAFCGAHPQRRQRPPAPTGRREGRLVNRDRVTLVGAMPFEGGAGRLPLAPRRALGLSATRTALAPCLPLTAGVGPAGCCRLVRSCRLRLAGAVERDRRWRPKLGRGRRRVWSDRSPEGTHEPEQREDEALAAGEKAASALGGSYIPHATDGVRDLAPRRIGRAADVKDVAVQTHLGLAQQYVLPAREAAAGHWLRSHPAAVARRGAGAAPGRRLVTCGGCWFGSDGRLSLRLQWRQALAPAPSRGPGSGSYRRFPDGPHRLRSEGRPFTPDHSDAGLFLSPRGRDLRG
jgi:hypothetical protein